VPVVVAPGRSRRPGALGRTTRVADAATCPFCEGHEAMTPPETLALGRPAEAGPDGPGWSVRVVPNKFPAIPGQEVVVHGPAHVLSFAAVPPGLLPGVGEAWRLRREAAAGAGADWVLVAVNEGPAAGASLDHSHSQIVPFAEAPPAVAAEAEAFAGGCPVCDALGEEGGRTVREADGLRTFAPSWSRFAYEVWVAPAAHIAEPDWAAVAGALHDAVARLRAVLGSDLAWNAVVHAPPAGAAGWHWHAEVWPRIAVPASVELAAGMWVNIVDPDVVAQELRAG
jgi:UDPglucose--hexose-1-phosphate uridylyltransferase